MLKEAIDKYYFDGNYNCAESLLRAANDCYGLDIKEQDLRLVGGFGGGMQTGNVCGAVLSAISVLSMKYVEAKAHESADIKPVTELFLRKFREKMEDSILCSEIKPRVFQPEVRCLVTVQTACDVLEEVIAAYQQAQ